MKTTVLVVIAFGRLFCLFDCCMNVKQNEGCNDGGCNDGSGDFDDDGGDI